MKIAYFDCFSGISGDMTLGALIDLGLPVEKLKRELKNLTLPPYKINALKKKRNGISGIKIDVEIQHKERRSRSFEEIVTMIKKSSFSPKVKTMGLRIFDKVAEAEAKVHQEAIDDVHFHEIGAIDSIIDIMGTSIGIEHLGIEEVYSSPIPFTRSLIQCEHGILPCPGPATLELLKGVPIYGMDLEKELVTPTGAAIITSLSKGYSSIPPLRLERIGYGVGSFQLKEIPNLLRIILGEREGTYGEDRALVIEANIDDMNPEFFDYLIERLFDEGALDVSLSSLQMKKNRPGVLLTVITSPEKFNRLKRIIFQDSTTTGIRYYDVNRIKLKRVIKEVKTPLGRLKLKVVTGPHGKTSYHPEYDDLKKMAKEKGISLREAEQTVQRFLSKINI